MSICAISISVSVLYFGEGVAGGFSAVATDAFSHVVIHAFDREEGVTIMTFGVRKWDRFC